jgi:hypothetical protein
MDLMGKINSLVCFMTSNIQKYSTPISSINIESLYILGIFGRKQIGFIQKIGCLVPIPTETSNNSMVSLSYNLKPVGISVVIAISLFNGFVSEKSYVSTFKTEPSSNRTFGSLINSSYGTELNEVPKDHGFQGGLDMEDSTVLDQSESVRVIFPH